VIVLRSSPGHWAQNMSTGDVDWVVGIFVALNFLIYAAILTKAILENVRALRGARRLE